MSLSSTGLVPKAVGFQISKLSSENLQSFKQTDTSLTSENIYGESVLWKEVTNILKKEKKYQYHQMPSRSSLNISRIKKLLKTLKFFKENPSYEIDSFCKNVKLRVFRKDENILDLSTVSSRSERYFYVVLYGFVSVFIPKLVNNEPKTPMAEKRDKKPPEDDVSNSQSDKEKEEKDSYQKEIEIKRYSSQEYQYSKGDSFGEECVINSFIKEIPKNKNVMWRSSSAVDETGLLCLNWDVYKQTIYKQHEKKLLKRTRYLSNHLLVPIFQKYESNILLELSKVLNEKLYYSGDVIMRQNDPGTEMYFILEGECSVLKYLKIKNKIRYFQLATLKRGEYFGELELLEHSHVPLKRNISVYATTKTRILSLSKLYYTTFIERSKDAVSSLKKYASGYPTDENVANIFMKKQKWGNYKKNLLSHLKRDIVV